MVDWRPRLAITSLVSVYPLQGAREQRIRWQNRRRVVVRRDTLRKLCESACDFDLDFNCVFQQNSLTGTWPFEGKNLPTLFNVIQRAKFKCPSWFVSIIIVKLKCPNPSFRLSNSGFTFCCGFALDQVFPGGQTVAGQNHGQRPKGAHHARRYPEDRVVQERFRDRSSKKIHPYYGDPATACRRRIDR